MHSGRGEWWCHSVSSRYVSSSRQNQADVAEKEPPLITRPSGFLCRLEDDKMACMRRCTAVQPAHTPGIGQCAALCVYGIISKEYSYLSEDRSCYGEKCSQSAAELERMVNIVTRYPSLATLKSEKCCRQGGAQETFVENRFTSMLVIFFRFFGAHRVLVIFF